MLGAFSLTDAPELAIYSPPVRRVLVRRALFLLHADSKLATWLQIMLPLGGAVLGVIVPLWVTGSFSPLKPRPDVVRMGIESNFLGGAIGCALGSFAWMCVRAGRVRPYLRRAIEDYEREAESN